MQSPETTEALVRLADQLGVAVTELWRVAKSMPAYQAVEWLPPAAFFGVVAVVLWRTRRHVATRDTYVALSVFAYIAALVAVACLAAALTNLAGLLNPNAYALEYILNRISR